MGWNLKQDLRHGTNNHAKLMALELTLILAFKEGAKKIQMVVTKWMKKVLEISKSLGILW